MKRNSLIAGIITVLLATAVAPALASMTPVDLSAESSFTDVVASNPHYAAISYLQGIGVIQGYPDGTFKPDQDIPRVEALKLILVPQFKHWNNAQDAFQAGASTPVSFSDTDTSQWYWQYIQEGYDNGLVQGYPDGTFKPASPVNKAENLKMLLNRYFQDDASKLDAYQSGTKFGDEEANTWYTKYVNAAATMNVVVADSSGNINPAANVTRGEFAEMVYRLMKIDDDGVTTFDASIPDLTIYTNHQYGFSLTTAPVCDGQFSIQDVTPVSSTQASSETLDLGVYVPLSKQWTAQSAWYNLNVMSQANYDKIPATEFPGQPPILLKLDNGMLLTVLTPQDAPTDINDCTISAVKSVAATSSTQEVSSTQASVSTMQIEGLTFTLPNGWSVASNANGQADLNVPDPQYHVTIPMEVILNPGYATLSDAQQEALLKTTASGAKIYENTCAPSIACYFLEYNGNLYDVAFGEPNSNEPVPANLEGAWYPSTTVTADDTLNFTATVQ